MARQEVEMLTHEGDMDDIDALFADKSLDEILANQEAEDAKTKPSKKKNPSGRTDEELINLDEDIRVTKKRAPVPKLDEERLLSSNGIPKLRKIAKSKKLRFRGKGHEFSDVSLLLRTYQIWLDDLFPRAKFADGLSIIEKAGHTKRMQVQRRAWINEDKHGVDESMDRDLQGQDIDNADATREQMQQETNPDFSLEGGSNTHDRQESRADTMDSRISPSRHRQAPDEGQPDLDELDELFAEQEEPDEGPRTSLFGRGSFPGTRPVTAAERNDYEDDEAALREMDLDPPW